MKSQNKEPQKFYDWLNAEKQPLMQGNTNYFELSLAIRILSIKDKYNMSWEYFN